MQANGDGKDRQQRLEAAARAAVELRAGRNLTDAEWTASLNRLLRFTNVLRGWEQQRLAKKDRID